MVKTDNFLGYKTPCGDIIVLFWIFCSYGPQILNLSAISKVSEEAGPLWKLVKTQQLKPALNESSFLFPW